MLRTLILRILASLKSDRSDGEFNEELESHLALLQERFERQGMDSVEARNAAQRQIGRVTHVKEALHERRTLPLLKTVFQDVR